MGHTSFHLDRRAFIKAGLTGAGALALGPGFLKRAFAAGPVTVVPAGPYGPLQPFDANGIALPPGFSSREIARGGQVVPAAGPAAPYTWHFNTDGQATFPTLGSGGAPDRGWILVANSELRDVGGVSAVEFAGDGTVERAYRILDGTDRNCAGGPTPWGTWLSCEEDDAGRVHECDPAGTPASAIVRPALGVFRHEAACVDPVGRRLYLTEDHPQGCWYRFTPTAYPDLSDGLLEAAIVGADGVVTWGEVPDPGAGEADPLRDQVVGAARFAGGEGTWYDDGKVYFTTKRDNRVWLYTIATSKLEVLYDEVAAGPEAPLSGVDNITVSRFGDVYVCEDVRDGDLCMITPDYTISRFLTLDPEMHGPIGDGGNELVGVVFSPDGTRMYFGAMRSFREEGVGPRGVVYEISGPFRQPPASGADTPPPPPPEGEPPPGPEDPVHATDHVWRGVYLGIPREMRYAPFLRYGFPLTLDIDQPLGVRARLDIWETDRYVPIARTKPSVALAGPVVLRLPAYASAQRRLAGRRRTEARLIVILTDAAGRQREVRRGLRLVSDAVK